MKKETIKQWANRMRHKFNVFLFPNKAQACKFSKDRIQPDEMTIKEKRPIIIKNGVQNFKSQYFGNWPKLSKRDKLLYDSARNYYNICEAYDKICCSGQRFGVPVPINSKEQILINRYALAVRAEILSKLKMFGFTENDFQEALIRVKKKIH